MLPLKLRQAIREQSFPLQNRFPQIHLPHWAAEYLLKQRRLHLLATPILKVQQEKIDRLEKRFEWFQNQEEKKQKRFQKEEENFKSLKERALDILSTEQENNNVNKQQRNEDIFHDDNIIERDPSEFLAIPSKLNSGDIVEMRYKNQLIGYSLFDDFRAASSFSSKTNKNNKNNNNFIPLPPNLFGINLSSSSQTEIEKSRFINFDFLTPTELKSHKIGDEFWANRVRFALWKRGVKTLTTAPISSSSSCCYYNGSAISLFSQNSNNYNKNNNNNSAIRLIHGSADGLPHIFVDRMSSSAFWIGVNSDAVARTVLPYVLKTLEHELDSPSEMLVSIGVDHQEIRSLKVNQQQQKFETTTTKTKREKNINNNNRFHYYFHHPSQNQLTGLFSEKIIGSISLPEISTVIEEIDNNSSNNNNNNSNNDDEDDGNGNEEENNNSGFLIRNEIEIPRITGTTIPFDLKAKNIRSFLREICCDDDNNTIVIKTSQVDVATSLHILFGSSSSTNNIDVDFGRTGKKLEFYHNDSSVVKVLNSKLNSSAFSNANNIGDGKVSIIPVDAAETQHIVNQEQQQQQERKGFDDNNIIKKLIVVIQIEEEIYHDDDDDNINIKEKEKEKDDETSEKFPATAAYHLAAKRFVNLISSSCCSSSCEQILAIFISPQTTRMGDDPELNSMTDRKKYLNRTIQEVSRLLLLTSETKKEQSLDQKNQIRVLRVLDGNIPDFPISSGTGFGEIDDAIAVVCQVI